MKQKVSKKSDGNDVMMKLCNDNYEYDLSSNDLR